MVGCCCKRVVIPVMMPVRPLLVGNSPALAAAELGPTDCTRAPEETLSALATWSVDSCNQHRTQWVAEITLERPPGQMGACDAAC